jgi:hypothetical protein
MFTHTGEERYRHIAWRALSWVFGTINGEGVFPYVLAHHGADLDRQDEHSHSEILWRKWPYDTSSCVGEGLITFATHAATPEMLTVIHEVAGVYLEFLLRTQNADGSWGVPGGEDQKRSPEVINFLNWYSRNVKNEFRIDTARCRYLDLVTHPLRARMCGLLAEGGEYNASNRDLTSLNGRAIADCRRPYTDLQWGRSGPEDSRVRSSGKKS